MDDHRDEPERGEPVIERNGGEYLVTLNGSVFLALSLPAAERMARQMRRGCDARPRDEAVSAQADALPRCA